MATRYVIGEAGARKLTALFNSGTLGPSGSRKNGLAIEDELPAPFSVEWAESVDSGSFIIWVPSSSVLLVDDTEVDPAADLEAAGGDYPSGWYILDGISSGSVFLNVHIPDDPEEDVTCSFSASADVPSQDEKVFPVCVANVSKNSSTGVVTVNQFVTSSIVLTRGGEGGSVQTDDLSTDDEGSGSKLQLLSFKDATAQSETLAEQMVQSAQQTFDYAERFDHTEIVEEQTVTKKKLRYRRPGRFVCGTDSNIVFTTNNGDVKVDVYYV